MLDGFVADGLGQMGFADAGRAEEQHILGFADELAGGQVENLLFVDGGVEAPVEVLQRFEAAEVGGLGAAFHLALLADVEFVLADEFQELGVARDDWRRLPAGARPGFGTRPERRSCFRVVSRLAVFMLMVHG